jgi:adenylosuccinate synthase
MNKEKKDWQTIVIIGAQWGDEGKGKITDYFARQVDYIVRFQGGNNAGHTIKADGEVFKLHLLPSGVLYKGKKIVIGNGLVVDPRVLLAELKELKERGKEVNLILSDRAHIIFPYHILMDGIVDDAKKELASGSTKRGIGPCYADKINRIGIRVVDLMNSEIFKEKFNQAFEYNYNILTKVYDVDPQKLNKEEIFKEYTEYVEQLRKFIGDASLELNQAIDQGKKILFEGAQGVSLGIDHGVYPHGTSSNTISGGACTGAGVGPNKIEKVLGVVKAYLTRVGNGPVPSEDTGEAGDDLRERGGEYGTTTGRPRRCGWLDLVQLKYSARVCGMTALAITKLDILGGIKKIPVCVKYKYQDTYLEEVPADLEVFNKCEPVYEEMDGWDDLSREELEKIVEQGYNVLPENMKKYLDKIESTIGVPIELVSFGPERKMTIDLTSSK